VAGADGCCAAADRVKSNSKGASDLITMSLDATESFDASGGAALAAADFAAFGLTNEHRSAVDIENLAGNETCVWRT
jgi:hypothetical protein